MFWSTTSPSIDLSEELNKEIKFEEVTREKHNTNDNESNISIVIEASDRKFKLPVKNKKKKAPIVISKRQFSTLKEQRKKG